MNTQQNQWAEFIKAVKQEVVPALGCTEPISLALASAIAVSHLKKIPEKIQAKVSPNLMKNGMGVTVPGTGMVGLPIAAAVGALGGNPEGKLEVLANLNEETVAAGKRMLEENKVQVDIANVPNILYAEATVSNGDNWVRVCIADRHTNVILIEHNGKEIYRSEPHSREVDEQSYNLINTSARDVYHFAINAPFRDIEFILESAKLNNALSKEGMNGQYGLHIGASLNRQIQHGLLSAGLLTDILVRTSAASDARMGGAILPAMSNSGSGNQGIAATMPIVVVAEHLNADKETLARALMLSHLMAVYIHTKLPKLSALCAVTTASMGAAAGMAWLLKGGYETVSMAICSMIGDISGMICDGASNSCAMKVSTSASASYKAVLMALDQTHVTGNEGIVSDDVDQSINNLCALASGSMIQTDQQILEIMVRKNNK